MRPLHEIAMHKGVHVQEAGEDGLAFLLSSPYDRGVLRVIASNGDGWDHVSVSLEKRTPTWEEMSAVRDICFLDTECCYELHVPRAEHLSFHPYCLHMWRPQGVEIPMPPPIMVAPPKRKTA